MSWEIFKKSMSLYMGNQSGISQYQDWGKKFTSEYDMAMRRGYQTINNVSIQKGNKDLMETMINLAALVALQKKEGQHDIINQLGKGIKMYWIGATLYQFPTPVIPATGAYQNILTTSSLVTKPGDFPDFKNQYPTNDTDQFLDMLIMAMNIHLFSIEGIYNTVSLYPGFPQVPPAPGIVQWVGYTVPPSSPSPPKPPEVPVQEPTTEELLQKVPEDNNTIEGARQVVGGTGVGILSDTTDPPSPQTKAIMAAMPPDKSHDISEEEIQTELNDEENKDVTCGDEFNYGNNLSPNYKVKDLSLLVSFPHRIKEQHDLTKEDIVCNLKSVSENILEPIKNKFPSVKVNSAFRGGKNRSGKISQHEKGEAIDIQFPGLKPKDYLPISKWIVENLPFDQFIFEHGNSIWLHISNKKNGSNRKQILTMYKGGYKPGIKCHYA